MKVYRFLRVGLILSFLGMCLNGGVDAQQRVEDQTLSRAEAIAQIAKLHPNGDKSPEQIYDEGQAWKVIRAFSQRLKYRDFDALMGPVYQDSAEIAASQRLDPPIEPKKYIGPTIPTGANPETWVAPDEPAYHDSTYARARAEAEAKQREDKKRPVQAVSQVNEAQEASNRVLLSSAAKDYSDTERRDMKRAYYQAMSHLPSDVRIAFHPKKVTVRGENATVEAEYGYEILGKPTIRSASFVSHPKKTIRLQMHREGEDWKVSNLRGILQQVMREMAN